ncbi:MAG TPA: MBL fold metallo-hydrolase [Thermoanaerobaculia bacterium]|nr:MBL fold metallo-hydrolase [Thermoanaerobaculia bacterium]
MITFLGTGTSTGVPVIGCACRVCTSDHPKNKRLRQSVKIEAGGRAFLIDTTPDLRLQLLREPMPRLDFILYTHSHSDHLMGLDDIRPFNFRQREPIQAFANPKTAKAIRRAFSYIWSDSQPGGGKPQLELVEIDGEFTHKGVRITPIPVAHGDWTILGFRVGGFAYITDTNGIPPASMKLLEGVEILALDGLRPAPPHPTHFTIDEAIAAARAVGAKTTYLIHLTHDIEHDSFEATLPAGVRLAYDGLKLTMSEER